MSDTVNLENLLISTFYGSKNEYESVSVFEENDPYVKWLTIDFAIESEASTANVSTYGNETKADNIARLFGALILGAQASQDGKDFIEICDDCDGDLYEAAEELASEDLLEGHDGAGRNVLYIHSLELSGELIEACSLRQFFGLIPRYVFQYTNVMPEIVCYQIASVEGYYEEASSKTSYDPRSMDKTSPQLFLENGYSTSESGMLLYRMVDNNMMSTFADENDSGFEKEDQKIDHEASLDDLDLLTEKDEGRERRLSPKTSTKQLDGEFRDAVKKIFARNKRSLLEDPLAVDVGASIALMPRTAPKQLIRYVQAAIYAHDLGIRMDYALNKYVLDSEADIPPIHTLFQKMYFAGKAHIDSTIERMHAKDVPSAGETFADAALVRASNTYYVAALLYREGHMIEAHAMSRLMLEQIAWAFAVCEVENIDAAKKIVPTKAISKLKKKIEPVGKMYGVLSDYVHIPIQGHYEFIDLSNGQSEVLEQFGAQSYAHGTIISHLADYWSAIYEYTQSRHFDDLENWVDTPSGLEMNPDRPFLSVIQPIREEMTRTYETDCPPYAEFIRSHWTVDDEAADNPEKSSC